MAIHFVCSMDPSTGGRGSQTESEGDGLISGGSSFESSLVYTLPPEHDLTK